MNELFLRRALGLDGAGGGEVWLAVVFLAGLLCAALWRPERVGRPALFRLAYVLFALYFVLPALADVIVRMPLSDPFQPQPFRPGDPGLLVATWTSSVVNLVGRAVFALSVVCGFGSLDVRRRAWAARPGPGPGEGGGAPPGTFRESDR